MTVKAQRKISTNIGMYKTGFWYNQTEFLALLFNTKLNKNLIENLKTFTQTFISHGLPPMKRSFMVNSLTKMLLTWA